LTGPRATLRRNMLLNLSRISSKSLKVTVGFSEKVGYYRKVGWTYF